MGGIKPAILVRSAITIIVLFVPAAFVVLRHILLSADRIAIGTWIVVAACAILLAPAISGAGGLLEVNSVFLHVLRYVADHVRMVMWELKVPERDAFTSLAIDAHRAPALVEVESLRVFQRTLTTVERDAAAGALLIQDGLPAAFTVLDVGGGDGKFTRHLLEDCARRGKHAASIVLVDPVDWQSEYTSCVGPLCQQRAEFFRKRLGDYPKASRFDLVIASHSLYGECHGESAGKLSKLREALLQVLGHRKDPGGQALVVLASGCGESYEFKRQALELLFGTALDDLVAEDLDGVLSSLVVPGVKAIDLDNLLVLSDVLDAHADSKNERVAAWLRYFLRVPTLAASQRAALDDVIALLRLRVQSFKSLPECEKATYLALRSMPIAADTPVLPHKTRAWVFPT